MIAASQPAKSSVVTGSKPYYPPSVPTHSFASRLDQGESFFGSAVFGEDRLGTGGPFEGFRILISVLDPGFDGGLELFDIVEGPTPDALSGDFGEQPLDEVEPGTGGRGEVQREAFVPRQPALHGRGLVGGVVVDDQMQIEIGEGLAVDLFEEVQELLGPMAGQAFANDRASRDIESRKQRRGAVALVIMGHGSGPALLQGQARLCAVECLDLAFLIDRKHERLLRRVEIEPDDILDLVGEVGIVGNLEAAHEMRLEAVLCPDTLHAGVADAHGVSHGPNTPVGGVGRALLHGLFHDRELNRPAERLPAGRFGATFDEPCDPGLHEIFLPAPDRGLRNPDLAPNRRDPMTVRVHKNDPGAFDDLLRRVPIGQQPVQFRSSFPLKDNTNLFVFHPGSESHFHPRIQMSFTEH